MNAPTGSKYPTEIDDSTTLFSLRDRKTFTLSTSITAFSNSIDISENCDALDAGFFLAFSTGEVVYVTGVDSVNKVFSIQRGSVIGSTAVSHTNGELMKMTVSAEYFSPVFSKIYIKSGSAGISEEPLICEIISSSKSISLLLYFFK